MKDYTVIKIIKTSEEDRDILGKYGIYLSGYMNDAIRVEIDNTEYVVRCDDAEVVDESIVVFDIDHSHYFKGWTIRTPDCKMGVNKDKIFCTCIFEDLNIFPSLVHARQYIEENFEIIQIGRINAEDNEEDSA